MVRLQDLPLSLKNNTSLDYLYSRETVAVAVQYCIYDPKRKSIIKTGSSRACGENFNRFSIHAEQKAINYCRECGGHKSKRYQIFIWRYAKDGSLKPLKCCNACSQLLKKYNFMDRIFTFDGDSISSANDAPYVTLGYKILRNL